MKKAPIPENEKQRLKSLHRMGILDSGKEARFDRITKIAARIFKVPISTLTLIDEKREWFKSCQGLPKIEGDRAISFCGHALVAKKDVFIVLNALKHPWFFDNPMVIGSPYIRFYAGVPLFSADGQRVGVFCIKDTKTHSKFSKEEKEILKGLAWWAEVELNSHNLSVALSEIKKKKRALQESENKNRAVLMSIGDGMAVVDKNMKTVEINPAAQDILGFTKEEAINKIWPNLVNLKTEKKGKISASKSPLAQAIKGKKIVTTLADVDGYFYEKKDKTIFPVAITATPIILDKKNSGAVVVFRDISKEKEIGKIKDEFLSLAAHQLRTPLSSTKWTLELLLEDNSLPEKYKEKLKALYSVNERLINLATTLLNASRIEAGRWQTKKEMANIVEIVNSCCKSLNPSADKKGQKINISVKGDIKEVKIDQTLFREAFNNILNNAINYGDENSVIEVTISAEKENYVIAVNNKGPVIEEKEKENIFQKFQRGTGAQNVKTFGSGIGLFFAKKAIEINGGKIWLESNSKEGTTFYFTIPFL